MPTGFHKHGITHISHSNLNAYRYSSTMWVMKYLFNWKDDKMYAAKRGSAVEFGLNMLMQGASCTQAKQAAKSDFEQRVQGEINDQIVKEGLMIEPMLNQLDKWVRETKPEVAATQVPVKTRLPGLDIDVVGYIDFGLLSGIDLDCKSTGRRPNGGEAQGDHKRQLSIYAESRGRPQQLLYVTPREVLHVEVSPAELKQGWEETTEIAHQLNAWLLQMPDKHAALVCAHFDPDFYQHTPEVKAKRKQLLQQTEN